MIYLLLFVLIGLAFLSYKFAGEDFFTPSTVQIMSFAVTVFTCIYFMWSLDCPHEFLWETIALISGTMALSAIIGIAVHRLFSSKVTLQAHTPETVEISPVPTAISVLILAGVLVTVIWVLSEIWRIGGGEEGGSFNDIMHRFRSLHSYSTADEGKFPFVLNHAIDLLKVVPLLYIFNLFRFWGRLKAGEKAIDIVIICLCGLNMTLSAGARTAMVHFILSCIIMFHLLRIQKQGGYQKYPLKVLAGIAVLLLAMLVGFFVSAHFVGRNGQNEEMDPADYIAYYTGTQYICLDEYLRDPLEPSDVFGRETFLGINSFLIRYHLVDTEPYIGHKEFRPVGAGYSNNVYSFIRIYHRDFGMAGVFILHVLMITTMSIFYEYVKKKRGNIGILIFSFIYYSVVMSFFTERFYSEIFTVAYVKMAVMLLAMYELFIRKRIRLDRILKSAKAQ